MISALKNKSWCVAVATSAVAILFSLNVPESTQSHASTIASETSAAEPMPVDLL
jgi:hypothetical protein